MPSKLARGCAHGGCAVLTTDPSCYCPEHKKVHQRQQDSHRGSSAQRGYGIRWQRARRWFLAEHPVCVECYTKGVVEPSTTVDHRIPHRGDMKVFWDTTNWQALCKHHHDAKTARESGWGK